MLISSQAENAKLREQLADHKKELRRFRCQARQAALGVREQELASSVEALKQLVSDAERDAQEAWNLCAIAEREKRRMESDNSKELK
eukprot:scaffold663609_cov881-Prasinocladus_malaysianus.AAC.1